MTAAPAELLRLERVTKSYGRTTALGGIDLELAAGEITGFVGPNGAGKSTCLRILTGIVARDGGAAHVLGKDPSVDPIAIRRRCSFLPGETSLYRSATGHEFLEMAYAGYREREEVVTRSRELFDLPLKRRVREYSAGMKQRLALRAALAVDVDLYLLDEPDRALDATARLQLRDALTWLRDEGRGILLSSHHLAEVEAIANRIVFVLAGRVVPEAELDAARRSLRDFVRVRLSRDVELPAGYTEVTRAPSGLLHVQLEIPPQQWLAALPPDALVSAELGATRLEDLYRALTERERVDA